MTSASLASPASPPHTIPSQQQPPKDIVNANSTMASKACCSVPPVLAVKDYKTKGDYTTTDGVKTCRLPPPCDGCAC